MVKQYRISRCFRMPVAALPFCCAILTLMCLSCRAPYKSTATGIFVAGADVYVAGKVWNYKSTKAAYWKNGELFELTDGRFVASAYSIFVSGDDVYVAGDDGQKATYWKNGEAFTLTNGGNNATARSIFISGDDVYVAGDDGHTAKYWKNDMLVNLTTGTKAAYVYSIFVSLINKKVVRHIQR